MKPSRAVQFLCENIGGGGNALRTRRAAFAFDFEALAPARARDKFRGDFRGAFPPGEFRRAKKRTAQPAGSAAVAARGKFFEQIVAPETVCDRLRAIEAQRRFAEAFQRFFFRCHGAEATQAFPFFQSVFRPRIK